MKPIGFVTPFVVVFDKLSKSVNIAAAVEVTVDAILVVADIDARVLATANVIPFFAGCRLLLRSGGEVAKADVIVSDTLDGAVRGVARTSDIARSILDAVDMGSHWL